MRIKGTARADTIFGSGEADWILGGRGNDVLDGGALGDRLNGEWGDDLIIGGRSWDETGNEHGDEWLYGGRGNDRIFDSDGVGYGIAKGGAGNDHLHINSGRAEGNAGNDLVAGHMIGTLDMAGGSGADTFVPIANGSPFVGLEEWLEGGYAHGSAFIEDFEQGVDKLGLRAELQGGSILWSLDAFRVLDTNQDGSIGRGGGDAETWLGTTYDTVDGLAIIVGNDPIYLHGIFTLHAEDMALI